MGIEVYPAPPVGGTDTGNQIIAKINTATDQITRVDTVSGAALEEAFVKASLDAMPDAERGYVQTNPLPGERRVISIQKLPDGKYDVAFDDTPVP